MGGGDVEARAGDAQNAVGEQGASSFTNTGTIEAIDINGGWGSVGADVGTEISSLTNSGTIQADYVVYYDTSTSDGVSGNISIDNSGKMIGAVALANGNDQITNTGTITGPIYFGDGDSVYNGVGGKLTGYIYLGFGTNTVTLGNDGETVFGGFGSDTITGGSGNDVIEIGGGDNKINGGGGFNVLSFADSPAPVTVNLGTGTATDDGTDTISNIQEVIGSQNAAAGDIETLTAGSTAAVLVAGTGLDNLVGGAGNDTLIAGPGYGTMTGGGGDNTFIYSAGGHGETITDFNTNDVLKIYGYGFAQSVIQQGTAVNITLSEQESIILQNTTLSELNAADLSYNVSPYPGLSLPASPPAYGTNTIYIEQNLTITAAETIIEQGQPYGFVNEGHSLDVIGAVAVSYPVEALSDYVYGWIDTNTDELGNPIDPTNDTLTFGGDATFSVSATEGSAVGFAPLFTTDLSNGGEINVTAAGTAYGVYAPTSVFNFTNGGGVPGSAYFTIRATGAAYGLALGDGGQIVNSASLSVMGGTSAYAVQIDQAQGYTLTNTGSLSASNTSGQAFGIAVAGLASALGGNPFTIDNSGTIAAQTAITEYAGAADSGQLPNLAIVNGGTIDGTIVLDSGSASLVNTGTIDGNVMLSDDSAVGPPTPGDMVDLSGGTFQGHIYIAPGSAGNIAIDDVIKAGSTGGVISIAAGESDLSASITGAADFPTTVQYDIASTQATETQNADGSWTVHAGTDGVETLTDVVSLQFTDKTVTLAAPSAAGNDFNSDDRGDFLIENTSGAVVVGEVGAAGAAAYTQVSGLGSEWKFGGDGDFLGDGHSGYLIENTAGAVDVGEVVNGHAQYSQVAGLGPEWSFEGVGDFLGDGKSDFLIENTGGAVVVGEVGAGGQAAYTQVAALGPEWKFEGTGDFLNDGKTQFLIENTSGAVDVGELGAGDQAVYTQIAGLGPEWKFVGVGDFLDRHDDQFLIENTSGAVVVGQVGANDHVTYTQITSLGPEWKFVGVGDYLDVGHDQFLIENASGAVDVGNYVPDFIADVFVQFTQVAGLGSEWAFH